MKRNIVVSVYFFAFNSRPIQEMYLARTGSIVSFHCSAPRHCQLTTLCVSFDGGAAEFLLADRKQGNYNRYSSSSKFDRIRLEAFFFT